MRNEAMEKALEETWKNKERFYEDTKGLSMLEIIKNIENKYRERGTSHNRTVYASPPVGGSAYEKTQSG
ncbi:hypothetical protein AGMMS49928_29850 [Spirochaetia bacterium]|nr:hypothetical protein AGMMS49928_29850 [Spirochaetia bacterium]